jgi:hypothetical protein
MIAVVEGQIQVEKDQVRVGGQRETDHVAEVFDGDDGVAVSFQQVLQFQAYRLVILNDQNFSHDSLLSAPPFAAPPPIGILSAAL